MTVYTVLKRDERGDVLVAYRGVLVQRGEHHICIDAVFDLADRDLGSMRLRRGDQLREWFYSDSYFNIFRVQDVDSGRLKGWYCNITRPARIEVGQIAADDLALDVVVSPGGQAQVLDEAEFAQLELSAEERKSAWDAVATLFNMVRGRQPPFDEIPPAPA